MQAAVTESERLLPICASDYYRLRHRLSSVADAMLSAASGGPISAVEIEDWWLEITNAGATLDNAWNARRPNLTVVK